VEIYEATPFPHYSYPVVSSEHEWPYRTEAAHFLTSLESGQPFVSSGEDALIDVWLSEEIYKNTKSTCELHENTPRSDR
jgi:predicted dehydrogenase